MKRVARRHPVLAAAFGLAALVTLAFVVKLGIVMVRQDAGRPVEGWMTPRYLVRVYDLPSESLAQTLGLAMGEAPRETLDQIARRRGIALPDLIAAIEALRGQPQR